jgi:hypothetical protein
MRVADVAIGINPRRPWAGYLSLASNRGTTCAAPPAAQSGGRRRGELIDDSIFIGAASSEG